MMKRSIFLLSMLATAAAVADGGENSTVPVYEDCEAEFATNSILADQVVLSYTGSLVELQYGLLQLQGGQVVFDASEIPWMGDPVKARHVLAGVFDYTCGHCRALHQALYNLQRNYGDDLAIAALPGTRGVEESRDVQLRMLVAFLADRPVYEKLANSIYFGQVEPKVAAIDPILVGEWGDRYANKFVNYEEKALDLMFQTRMLMEINRAQVGSMSLPQLMVGKHIALGAAKDARVYYTLIREQLGLEERFPVLQSLGESIDLGKAFAGARMGLEIPLHNVGNAPLMLGQLVLPNGAQVLGYPREPIGPADMKGLQINLPIPLDPGPFEMPVSVIMNTVDPVTTIKFTGQSWSPLRLEPEKLEFVNGQAGRIEVSLDSEAFVRFGPVLSTHPAVGASLRTVEEGSRYVLDVTYDPAQGVPVKADVMLQVAEGSPGDPWPPSLQLPVVFKE